MDNRIVWPLAPIATPVAGTSRALVMRTVETEFGLVGAAMAPVAASKRPVAVTMRKIMAIPLCTYKDALCVTGVIQ